MDRVEEDCPSFMRILLERTQQGATAPFHGRKLRLHWPDGQLRMAAPARGEEDERYAGRCWLRQQLETPHWRARLDLGVDPDCVTHFVARLEIAHDARRVLSLERLIDSADAWTTFCERDLAIAESRVFLA